MLLSCSKKLFISSFFFQTNIEITKEEDFV